MRSFVNGCVNASRYAWRNWRVRARRRDAVDRIAHDRQVDRGQMDADLVGPPRLEPHVEQRVAAEQLGDLEVRDRLPRRVRVERLARRVVRSRPIGASIRPAPRARPAADERDVAPLDRALADQLLQPLVRLVGARDDQEARRVAVEPVHDPGPVAPPRRAARPSEAVDERALPWPAPGCTTTPAGLSTTSRCSSS